MAGDGQFGAKKMLDNYIYDYLVRMNRHRTAKALAEEANLDVNNFVGIDSPDGFLGEWWSVFWDVYSSRFPENAVAMEGSSSNSKATTEMMEHIQQSDCSPISAVPKTKPDLLGSSTYLRPFPCHARPPSEQIPMKAPQHTPRDGKDLERNSYTDSTLDGNPSAGKKKRASSMPLKGWPFSGMDHPSSRVTYPALNFNTQSMKENRQFQRSRPFTRNLGNLMAPTNGLISLTNDLVPGGVQYAEQQMLAPGSSQMLPMSETASEQLNDQLIPQQFYEGGRIAEEDNNLDLEIKSILAGFQDDADIGLNNI